jgi:hypothetical protein
MEQSPKCYYAVYNSINLHHPYMQLIKVFVTFFVRNVYYYIIV